MKGCLAMLNEHYELAAPRRLDKVSMGVHFFPLHRPFELWRLHKEHGCQLVSSWKEPFYIYRNTYQEIPPSTMIQEIDPTKWRRLWKWVLELNES